MCLVSSSIVVALCVNHMRIVMLLAGRVNRGGPLNYSFKPPSEWLTHCTVTVGTGEVRDFGWSEEGKLRQWVDTIY